MRKIYELLLFIVGSSVGWNLAFVKPSSEGVPKVLSPRFAGVIKGGDMWMATDPSVCCETLSLEECHIGA
jgi:hypothetical protein